MTGDIVIRAEGLGKKYLIGNNAKRESYVALRDVLARNVKGFTRSAKDFLSGRAMIAGDEVEEFWALKDVNFEIKRGEVVGVVGRNGAGKSTLLKMLSRITEPSEGRVSIKGRVGSLLEVGTGFHPELTGRENIFLNGAILGMSRSEIKRRFDEIVDFAEVEKFLDTPVKRYSSGMYVRLAFGVAAHLEPDILLVDEVLAVGDAKFQKKSQAKLKQVSQTGHTVLFVSHNLSAISALCDSGILLRGGAVIGRGSALDILTQYSQSDAPSAAFEREVRPDAALTVTRGQAVYNASTQVEGAKIVLNLSIFARENVTACIDLRVKDALGAPAGFGTIGGFDPSKVIKFTRGDNVISIDMGAGVLANGAYSISIDLVNPNIFVFDQVEDGLFIEIESIKSDNSLRTLEQAWGYGSILFPLTLLDHT